METTKFVDLKDRFVVAVPVSDNPVERTVEIDIENLKVTTREGGGFKFLVNGVEPQCVTNFKLEMSAIDAVKVTMTQMLYGDLLSKDGNGTGGRCEQGFLPAETA